MIQKQKKKIMKWRTYRFLCTTKTKTNVTKEKTKR